MVYGSIIMNLMSLKFHLSNAHHYELNANN